MSTTTSAFSAADSAILLIDHQPGVLGMVGSVPHEVIKRNVGILARLGEETEVPLLVSSTREFVEFLGTNIDEVQQGAPKAYAARIARGGTLNAFDDPKLVEAVAALNRKNLVIAGVLTDVCLWHSATSAQDAGYNVTVIADASGTTTELADQVTYDALRARGIGVTTTWGILFQMFPDLSTPDGQAAEAIASGLQLAAA